MYGGVRFDNVNQNVGHDAAASWLSLWDRQGWRAFFGLRVEGVGVSHVGFGQGKLLLVGIYETLRVQVPNYHILTQNLYQNYYYPTHQVPNYWVHGPSGRGW